MIEKEKAGELTSVEAEPWEKSDPDFFVCPIEKIIPNRYQPRTVFIREKLDELRDSISQKGILNPLLVRKINGFYELITGERRFKAAEEANLSHVPVFVKNLTESQTLEVSIIENIQRENLNILEEAQAYHILIKEFGYTQEKVARKISKSRSTVANLLRLRSLPQLIKESLVDKRISTGHARALLGIGEEEKQLSLLRTIVDRELSVRETEKLVRKMKKQILNPEQEKEEYSLERTTGIISDRIKARVSIKRKGDKGKIEIDFESRAEFNRLINILNSAG